MRLAGIEPDFGHISSPKRSKFAQFCIRHGFIAYLNEQGDNKLYEVLIPFRYESMFSYQPRPVVMTTNRFIMVGKDFKMGDGGGKFLV